MMVEDFHASYGSQLGIRDKRIFSDSSFKTVPTLQEIDESLELLKKINKHLIERHAALRIEPLTDSDKSDFSFDHKNFYDLIISHIIIFILNFFKSQTKSKLHLIKNKLFIENI